MKNGGWIKIHRELLNKPIWLLSSPQQKTILITLLLMANHSPQKWEFKGKPYICEAGQFITSLERIVEKSGKGISPRNVRTAIKRFENLEFLTNESTKLNRLITITNWYSYQSGSNEADKQNDNWTTNDRQTTDKQPTTNKNDKKNEQQHKKGWRDDFKIYLSECNAAYTKKYNDTDFIKEQSRLNPNVNIKLSIEKGYTNFWGKEAGWRNKKKSDAEEIDWDSTIINSISMNRVYFTKEEMASL